MRRTLLHAAIAATATTAVATATLASAAPPPARATADRPDETGPYSVHVIYMVAQDAKDRALDTAPSTRTAFDSMQRWLTAAADGRRWRFDTHKGALDVTFLRATEPTAAYDDLSDIEDELISRGFDQNATKKRYLVLFDGAAESRACGEAIYPIYGASSQAGVATGPRLGGSTAAIYLRSDPRCKIDNRGTAAKPGHFQAVVLHELVHLEGVVSQTSPHRCNETVLGAHVCAVGPLVFQPEAAALDPERRDVMFPAPNVPLSEKTLDAGNDDYYRTVPRPGMVNLEDSAYLLGNSRAGTPRKPDRLVLTHDWPESHG